MATGKSFEDLVEQAFTMGGQPFDELYRLLYCYLRFMGNHSDAEDVAQETMIKVWEKWQCDVQNRACLKSWVLQIAHNKAIDHLRKRHRDLSLQRIDEPDESPLQNFLLVLNPEDIPEESIERKECKDIVWKALDTVSVIHRSCLILRLMYDIPPYMIADLHKCSLRQVQRYVKQGRLEFKVAYERLVNAHQLAERRSTL